MQLSTLASKANLLIPTSLVGVNNVDYHIVDYNQINDKSSIESVINPRDHWDIGCTITPHGKDLYYVSLSVFQSIKHFPVVTVQVNGSFADAGKIFQICEKFCVLH